MKQKRTHDRAPTQTTLTCSVPRWLKKAMKDLARADRRSLSNWLVAELTELLNKKYRVAEEPPKYGDEQHIDGDGSPRAPPKPKKKSLRRYMQFPILLGAYFD